jgi:hypothetical protein
VVINWLSEPHKDLVDDCEVDEAANKLLAESSIRK